VWTVGLLVLTIREGLLISVILVNPSHMKEIC